MANDPTLPRNYIPPPPASYDERKRIVVLEEGLRFVVDALDDAIKHNVNATEHDPAGWTQEDYDAWDEARKKGEALLGSEPIARPVD